MANYPNPDWTKSAAWASTDWKPPTPIIRLHSSFFFEDYAQRHRLLVTGGSDCHGPGTNPLGMASLEIPNRPLPPVIHLRNLLDNPPISGTKDN